jgi:hypothetical protein
MIRTNEDPRIGAAQASRSTNRSIRSESRMLMRTTMQTTGGRADRTATKKDRETDEVTRTSRVTKVASAAVIGRPARL